MSELSDTTLDAIDDFWANRFCCTAADFDSSEIGIVERRASDGSDYVYLLRRKLRLQINCSASLVHALRNAARDQPAEVVFDPGYLRRALSTWVERIVGPAYVGYLDTIDPALNDPRVRLLTENEAGALDQLRSRVTAEEWEHSGLKPVQPIAGYFADDGELVSAASYAVWAGRIAHIGVVTVPPMRGAGCGRRCVRGICAHAIGQGLIAQYRTLYDNAGSMAIARALGFNEYGATIYAAGTTT